MLQWVRIRSGPNSLTGSAASPNSASRPWSVVASADDRVGLGAERRGDRVAVLGQVADRLEAGHHPVDRPAEVDRRRAGAAKRGRGAARGSPGGRTAACPRARSADRARPIAATWPIAGAPRTTIWRIAVAASGPFRTSTSTSCVGQLAAGRSDRGRRRPRGTASGTRSAAPSRRRSAPPASIAASSRSGRAGRVEDRAGGLGRRPLERLGGAGDRRRGLDQLAGELAEEPPPGEVRASARRGSGAPRAGRRARRGSGRRSAPRHRRAGSAVGIGVVDRVGQCALAGGRVGRRGRRRRLST